MTEKLYEDQPIRTVWNETEEEWYFSIDDRQWACPNCGSIIERDLNANYVNINMEKL